MADAKTTEYFEARVRPILAANCYECHADQASGGLRVDSREALLKGGDSGPAIVPGDPDRSLLIQAVKRLPDAPQMPSGRPRLKADDIDVLVDWVRAGALWPASSSKPVLPSGMVVTPEHRAFWAFQPLRATKPPAVKDAAWAKTDIDRFILARLAKEGLRPAPAADKLSLIRRATLDLTGLPPSAEEVDAFVADKSPEAFARVIDRLLASPRYGEAWGRIWLDVARYSEDDYRSLGPASYGNAYLYRDWVINAFNDDLPWDQFVRAQIAADLGDDATRVRNLPALGFLGLGPWFYDNGSVEVTRADERHDRVDAVSRGFLGLTVACARCHDHKYDPIPTRDYYAFAGVFLNTQYTEYPLAPKSVVDEYKDLEKKIQKKQQLLNEYLGNESKQLAGTLVFQVSKYMQAAWRVVGEPKADKNRVVDSEKLDYELFDRFVRFVQKPPVFYPDLKPWQEMVKNNGGTQPAAKRLADEFQAKLIDLLLDKKAIDEENDIIRAKALPGTKKKEPAQLPNEFITNDDFCPGCGLSLKSLPTEKMNLWVDVFQRDLDSEIVAGQESGKAALLVFNGWGLERQLGPDRRALIETLRSDIAAMRKTLPEKYAYIHGVKDVEKPVDLNIAIRGNPFRSGDVVPRGFLTVLGPGEPVPFTKGSGRLELADMIVRQPIAIRVIVNRIWKGHMGSGIVDTPSNFGKNGERPVHPELLEFLAQKFVGHKYSIKAMHREIMLSAAYQLSSAASPLTSANVDKDAANRLYWRGNTSRMTAEQIRDAVLFVSGTLNTKMGGPSIALTPMEDRRTIYGRVSRFKLDEFLQLFDYPSPSQSAEKRFSTNVPLQRLFFMNSDFMQQHAEKLAERVIALPTDEARIQKAYRLIFGRAATPEEVKAGLAYLAAEPMKQYEDAKAAKAKAEADAKAGKKPETPAPAGDGPPMPPVGMMAGVVPGPAGGQAGKEPLPVTVFGRYVKVLLSSNEFLFVR